MSSTVYDIDVLKTRARQRVDMEGSSFVTDDEIDVLMRESLSDLHDILLKADAEAKYAQKRATIATTIPVTGAVALPSDFYRLRGLYWLHQDYEIPLEPWDPSDHIRTTRRRDWANEIRPRYNLRRTEGATTPSGLSTLSWSVYLDPVPSTLTQTIVAHYIVRGPVLVDVGPDTFVDMPFTEYSVLDVAIKLLQKQRSDTSELVGERDRYLALIEEWGTPIDHGQPPRAIDVNRRRWPYFRGFEDDL